ncbi:MAG: SUMF1/EgtB/PvdO family nonheme iron enzyme [Deltaproteobacteria bacterium]|nr:SUMF1/EgtB/PvdO family nonheme iron enzyme [Deltaproteobacteria bacterium]
MADDGAGSRGGASLLAGIAVLLLLTQAGSSRAGPPEAEGAACMLLVPAGPFWMGCDPKREEACPENEPGRQIDLAAFYIDRHEVTVAQYAACMQAGECTPAGEGGRCNGGRADRARHPVNCVDFSQAQAYCRFRGLRLPSEAEWEKAARGEQGSKYPWGDAPASCDRAVMSDRGGPGCGSGTTLPVCSRPQGASPHGLCDAAGNVWEWVAGDQAVSRGGGFDAGPQALRASARLASHRGLRNYYGGFRCAGDQAVDHELAALPSAPEERESSEKTALEQEAREQGQKALDHVIAMMRLIAEPGQDCEQALAQAEAYVKEHGADLGRKLRRLEQIEKEIGRDRWREIEKELDKLAKERFEDVSKTIPDFTRRCPEQMGRLGQLIKSLEKGEPEPAEPPAADEPPAERVPEPGLSAEQQDLLDIGLKRFESIETAIGVAPKHGKDCEAAIRELSAYVQAHREEFKQINRRFEALRARLGEEQLKQVDLKIVDRSQGTLRKVMQSMMDFHRECPQHVTRFNELMRAIDEK